MLKRSILPSLETIPKDGISVNWGVGKEFRKRKRLSNFTQALGREGRPASPAWHHD